MKNNSSGGFNVSRELGALASLAGLAGKMEQQTVLIFYSNVQTGREFIIEMQKKLSLDEDNYFNQYDPDYKDPYWKAAIKQIFGLQKTELEKNAIIENERSPVTLEEIFGLT